MKENLNEKIYKELGNVKLALDIYGYTLLLKNDFKFTGTEKAFANIFLQNRRSYMQIFYKEKRHGAIKQIAEKEDVNLAIITFLKIKNIIRQVKKNNYTDNYLTIIFLIEKFRELGILGIQAGDNKYTKTVKLILESSN